MVECIFKRKPSDNNVVFFNRPPQPVAEPIAVSSCPGTELKRIFSRELGVKSCAACRGLARQMNNWGVAGCKDNRAYIVGELTKRMNDLGIVERVTIAAKAMTSGLAFKLDLADVTGSLVDEAIRRAEQSETEEQK